ncbi:hypothetical protein D4R86_04715 [bacterium]|nr:MAG: hypothetical protein D4R86_04715 [bacterium]
MSSQFNELIVLAKDGGKKKGGSLGAIFKLIQDLLEFEDKIVECSEAQEMGENKERIEALKAETGEMYNTLFEMAQGGVDSYRTKIGSMEGEDYEVEGDEEDMGLEPSRDLGEDMLNSLPKPSQVSSVTAPSSLRLPEKPRM